MNRFLAISANTLAILLMIFAATVATADSAVPAQQRPGQAGLYKAAQMSKASTPLVRVLSEYRAHVNQGRTAAFAPSDQFLQFSAGRVLIDKAAASQGLRSMSAAIAQIVYDMAPGANMLFHTGMATKAECATTRCVTFLKFYIRGDVWLRRFEADR